MKFVKDVKDAVITVLSSPKNLGIIFVIVALLIIMGIYQVKRSMNYSFGYKSRVVDTVCDMVKSEYLKNPGKCD